MMPRQWPHWHTSSTHHTYGPSKHIAPPAQVPGPWEPPLEATDMTTGPNTTETNGLTVGVSGGGVRRRRGDISLGGGRAQERHWQLPESPLTSLHLP